MTFIDCTDSLDTRVADLEREVERLNEALTMLIMGGRG
jgi:hypothetical protein